MMENQEISRQLKQVLKKSHGEPTSLMEFITSIQELNSEGRTASYPGIVRKMWPEEWKQAKDKINFEKTKWDLLRKRRREINARLFSSDLSFKFYIKLSPEKHFEILTAPEDIRLHRLKELETNLVKERSKSRKEKILQQIVELNTKSGNLAKEESGKGDAQAGGHPTSISPEAIKTEKNRVGKKVWAAFALAAVLVVIAAGLILKTNYFRPPSVEKASIEKMAFPLPDKPSVAGLACENMSGDPEQEYFSDGLSEEIITALSSVPELFVIARNSTFTYKGKPVKVQQISEELGVQYILEGSVRKSGEKVRITAQLIDALKGRHLWAQTYDRKIEDLFAVQEEITFKVITALREKITGQSNMQVEEPCTSNLEAYLKSLKALGHHLRSTRADNDAARRLLEEAIALDAEYACAYSLLGAVHMRAPGLGASQSRRLSFATAKKIIDKAIELNPSLCGPHAMLAYFFNRTGQYEKSFVEAEKALALGPNSHLANGAMGSLLQHTGRSEESIPFLEKAIRLDPFLTDYYPLLGTSYFLTGQYEEAIRVCKIAVDRKPNHLMAHLGLAAAYSAAGREKEAHESASEVIRINPTYSLERDSKKIMKRYEQADSERIIKNLRKAGLK